MVICLCSQRNKALAQGCGMEFNAAVTRIKDILRHSTVVGHNIFQDLDVFAISSTVPHRIYDMADCKGLQEAKLPIRAGEKPALKALAEALLGRDIQRGRHDPCEDAYASLQLYLRYSYLRKQGRHLKERLHWPSIFRLV